MTFLHCSPEFRPEWQNPQGENEQEECFLFPQYLKRHLVHSFAKKYKKCKPMSNPQGYKHNLTAEHMSAQQDFCFALRWMILTQMWRHKMGFNVVHGVQEGLKSVLIVLPPEALSQEQLKHKSVFGVSVCHSLQVLFCFELAHKWLSHYLLLLLVKQLCH